MGSEPAGTPAPYAGLVAEHGLSAAHRLVAAAVPHGALVLDVGCATGYLAAELTSARGATVTGVEADGSAQVSQIAPSRSVTGKTLSGAAELATVCTALEYGPKPKILPFGPEVICPVSTL